MDSMELVYLLAGVVVTAFAYMAFPLFCLVYNDGQFEKKKAKRIALWNSIICGLIFFVATLILYKDAAAWSVGPACLYYGINCALLTDKTKIDSDVANTEYSNFDIVEYPTTSEKKTVDPKETNREELLLLYEQFYKKQKELEKGNQTLEDIRKHIEEIERN